MCGIHLTYDTTPHQASRLQDILEGFQKIQQRGPDSSHHLVLLERIFLGFHRLAMIDTSAQADQPFSYQDDTHIWYVLCNGEIYNYKDLICTYALTPSSGSDCEVIGLLTMQLGFLKTITLLRGEFACCVVSIEKSSNDVCVYIARDHIGVRPLFIGESMYGFGCSSELKGIAQDYETIRQVEPGKVYSYSEKTNTRDEHIYIDYSDIPRSNTSLETHQEHIYTLLSQAVTTRLQTDRPFACLLSGGLDSSLIAALAARASKDPIHTFTIGMEGATDLPFGQMVADHIGSHHHVVMLGFDEGLQAIDETIYTIESYDITSVRASVRQFLIAKYICSHMDFKAILCGELSDELCSGYKYFHSAPDAMSMHSENVRLVQDVHRFDGLRTDRTMAYHGLEVRLPFADQAFVSYYLSIDPTLRMPRDGIEKWLLRSSFDRSDLLPKEVLRRSKEAFSDGVSGKQKSWFQIIQEYIESLVSDEEFATESKKYIHNTPISKESYYYRKKFEEYFGKRNSGVIPYFCMPRWSGEVKDPSARVLGVYE